MIKLTILRIEWKFMFYGNEKQFVWDVNNSGGRAAWQRFHAIFQFTFMIFQYVRKRKKKSGGREGGEIKQRNTKMCVY